MMDLRDVIASIRNEHPSHGAVRYLIEESHRLAIAYLKAKVRPGSLQVRHFGLPLEDLALDCLADLFQRDENGRFVQLVNYFESVNWQEQDEAGLRIALRRLVFSQMNGGLFRRHRGHDPELARIIRNVKNAVKASDSMSLVRRGKELWMVKISETSLGGRPPIPFELLEAHITGYLHPGILMPEVLIAFQTLIDAFPNYAPEYPVSRFALALRSAHMRLAATPLVPDSSDLPFSADEVQQDVQEVITEVHEIMHKTYVVSGKVDEQMFIRYMQATREILEAQFCTSARPVDSYFDALVHCENGISKNDYRRKHRHVLEYLVKTSRTRLVDRMRERVLEVD